MILPRVFFFLFPLRPPPLPPLSSLFWLGPSLFSWSRSSYHDVAASSLLLRSLLHVAAALNPFTTMFFELLQRLSIKDILNVGFQTDGYQSAARQSVVEIASMRLCFLSDLMKSRDKKILSVKISDLAEFHERNGRN